MAREGDGLALRPTVEEERFIDEQRVPNLEDMNEQAAERFLTELVSHLTAERLYEISHETIRCRCHNQGR
jgi:hypothetical protein